MENNEKIERSYSLEEFGASLTKFKEKNPAEKDQFKLYQRWTEEVAEGKIYEAIMKRFQKSFNS